MSASDELAKTETQLAHYYAHLSSGDADQVHRLAADLEETAADLKRIAADLGVEGTSADAAGEAFVRVVKEMRSRADEFTAAANVASNAYAAVLRARDAYQALPAGSIDATLRSAIVVGGRVVAGPVGELVGDAAVDFLDGSAARAREEKAEKALTRLTSEMELARAYLPEVVAPRDVEGATETIDIDSLFGTSSGSGEPGPYPRPRTPGTVIPGGSGSGGGGGSTPTVPPVVVADPDGPKPPGGGGEDNPSTDNPTDNPGTDDKDPGDDGSADGDTTGDDGSTVKNPTGGGGVGGTGGGTGGGGAGGLLGGGLAIGGAAAGAIGLGRGLGLGAGGLGGGAAGMGGIGMAGGAGGAGGAAGGRGAGLAGSRTGGMAAAGTSTTGGAAGSRGAGMVGGGGASAGGAGGASKKRRRGGAGYLGPDIDIEDDAEVVELGAGARAGGRGSVTVAAEVMDDIDDETW